MSTMKATVGELPNENEALSNCLSSNLTGRTEDGRDFGGNGWIIDPEGNVLGLTSDEKPFLTLDLDLSISHHAKQTYPRYVLD